MSKKMISSICGIIFIISCGICSIGYAIGDTTFPWWLIVFCGGIVCAILSQIGGIQRETDNLKKHKKIIGCICSSISMISVLIFLTVMMFTNNSNSWIIVMIGGMISGIIYMIDNAKEK